MKTRLSNPYLASLASVLTLAVSYQAHAASATWNGSPTDATWATTTNWSATPVPGTGDTATFNSAGGATDVLDLGVGVTVSSLLFDTANVAAYTIGSGGAGSQTLSLNSGGNITLNNTIANDQLINANVALLGNYTITNNDTANTLTIAGGISGTGFNLTKTGVGTLVLSGLSTTAANNYTGTTILGGGTTSITQDASFTGGLTFGSAIASANVSTLNLNSASATYAGAMLIQTNSTSPTNNTITIGTGEKLTINANVNFGTSADNSRSGLTVSGAGGWDVVSSNGTFGGTGTTTGSGGAPTIALDMSGLAEFNANLRTGGTGDAGGTFRVGNVGTGTNTRNNTVSLATKSTISAEIVELRTASVGSSTLLLGDGAQTINSDTIRMSSGSSRAESSAFNFRTTTGTLTIRGTDGINTTRSSLTMLSSSNSGSVTSTFDVTGHDADLLFGDVKVLSHGANTATATTNTATFSFDSGNLDATTFQIAAKTGGSVNNLSKGIANIGSTANLTNASTFGAVNMGILSSAGTIGVGSGVNAELNIKGSSTTVGFTTMSMANYSGTTGSTVTSAVNISGGATTGSGGIDMSTAANGTVNSTLTVSGGTLSVGTGGISAPNGIYRTAATNTTATVIINGGSLDLNGNAIGGSGANAITTQFESGTLSNVSQINGGAGLTKTTVGTLALATANTFTGNTLVSAGTLVLDNNLALQRSALDTDGAGVVTLGSLITTPTLGGLTGTKNLASSITTGYSSVTNLTLNPQSGTVTYSGNITNGATGMTLTKSGAGTQVLSGLSTTAANNYTGTTILDGGTLSLTQNASFTGGLNFGAADNSGNASSLDLSTASATFAGTMLVRTGSSVNNTITIGTGQKLTNNGDVTWGSTVTGLNTAKLTVSGLGTWDVIKSNGVFGSIGSANGSGSDIDIDGLAELNINLRTGGSGNAGGIFRVGLSGGTTSRSNYVRLAAKSTISADAVDVGQGGQTGAGAFLVLGTGTQIINSDTIRVGTGIRDSAKVSFGTANGTLKIRGTDGADTSRSSLAILSTTSTGTNVTGTFDVTGHDADLLFNSVTLGTTGGAADSVSSYTSTLGFDFGTFDASSVTIYNKTSGDISASTNTVNIGNATTNAINTAKLGTVTMGGLTTTGAVTGSAPVNAALNITGSATTASFTTLSMANYTGTTGATVTSAVNISGGTTTGTGGINMAAAANGTVNSTLTVSDGSLSVGTSGVSATNGIYRTTASVNATTTLRLNGGSLDLNGNSIGGADAITTQFETGTLSNVGEINGGAGLTKTTSGTLTITGTNTYTGDTLVSAGTLLVNGSLGNTAVTVSSGATIGGTGSLAASLGLNSGAKLDLTGASLGLTSTGILTANSTITLTNFGFSSIIGWDYEAAALGTYTLINGGNSLTLAGTTPTEASPFTFLNGNKGYFQAGSLQAVIVPEPRAALLGSLGMLMLLRRRRA